MAKKVDFVKSLSGLGEARLKKLSFAHSIAPLENPQSIRSLRRDIARLKTALRKQQLGF